MSQRSLPQQGDKTATATYVDSGPYTADQWAEYMRYVYTTDQQATQGVLRGVDNELAVTNPSGLTLNVATGAGFVNGHLLISDSVAAISASAGTTRPDALAMVENNTNAALTAGANPAVYNTVGNVDIPPYSARLAVVKNWPANATYTTALYTVPLATFTTGAATITNLTDVRDFCDFASEVTTAMLPNRTRYIFVPATFAFNATTSASADRSVLYGGWDMDDGDTVTMFGHFVVPADYSTGLSVEAVVIPEGSGNLSCQMFADYGQCGEQYNIHADATGSSTTAVTSLNWECVQSLALANEAIADMVWMQFSRYGGAAADTVGADVNGIGFLATYTADS